MGSFSDYAEKKILELIVGKTAFSTPVAYIAASTADPLDDGSGIAEPADAAYARVQTAAADWAAAVLGAGTIVSAEDITFPEAEASWGEITHFAAFDAAEAGNMLFHGILTNPPGPKTIGIGDTLYFAAGDLGATLS